MGPTVVILLWVVLFMLMGALLGMNMYMVSERTGAGTSRRRTSRDPLPPLFLRTVSHCFQHTAST